MQQLRAAEAARRGVRLPFAPERFCNAKVEKHWVLLCRFVRQLRGENLTDAEVDELLLMIEAAGILDKAHAKGLFACKDGAATFSAGKVAA